MEIILFSYKEISISDWISISEILITSCIGIWIGISVQKNLTNNRALKEYFIIESQEIKKAYSNFLNCTYKGNSSSKSISEWFKIMTIRIDTFQGFLKKELVITPRVLPSHNNLKRYITGTDEFNNNYNLPQIELSVLTRNRIIELHSEIVKAITQNVISINRAKRRTWIKKLWTN
jgi:hypothetical protein